MSCLTVEELYAYLDGGLSPEGRRHIEAHAVACAECRALLEDRRTFLEAASSLPPLDIPVGFAASIRARLDGAPVPERKRLPLWTWLAAGISGAAAFLATLAGIALLTGQNLWLYLARLQHGFVDYLQGALAFSIRLLKYIVIFRKVAAEFGSALMDTARRALSFISPQVQAAFAITALLILATAVILWRRRTLSLENDHDE